MKILIFGTSSPIGKSFYNFLKRETNYDIYSVVDVRDIFFEEESEYIIENNFLDSSHYSRIINEISPDVVIYGYSYDIEDDDESKCWDYNTSNVEILFNICCNKDIHLVAFSSNKVFDGKNGLSYNNSIPNPETYYGKCKLAVEQMVTKKNSKTTIIRITDWYGYNEYGNGLLIGKILNNLNVICHDNVFYNPLFLDDLAIVVYKIIEKKVYGIINAGGKDLINEYEFYELVRKTINNTDHKKCFKFTKPTSLNYGLDILETENLLNMKFSNLNEGLSSVRFYSGLYKL